jgi:hypothetical protein
MSSLKTKKAKTKVNRVFFALHYLLTRPSSTQRSKSTVLFPTRTSCISSTVSRVTTTFT